MAELTLLLRKAKRSNDIKIDLSNRQIHFLPQDIYSLNKLEILDLSNNKLTSLDQKISQLTNLKVLDLRDNSIMELSKDILLLSNLQVLNLQGNPLTKKFQPLLNKSAQTNIQKTLRQCFGLQTKQIQQNQTPLWLNQKQPLNDTKTFSKILEIQNKYKSQQKKVQQLQKQLDKLSIKQNKSKKQSFQLNDQSILQIYFQDLNITEQISMGGFSTIHKGVYKGLKVAVKKNFNPKINQELIQQFSNQISMLSKFRHPNIVLLIGICSIPPNLAIVTQYIQKGSLYDLLHKKKTMLSDQDKRKLVKQIISSIAYLHQHDVVHRDIKSHNFLVDQNLTVKLCDFGLAKYKNQLNQGAMQFSGTPVYMAQQLFMKKSYDQSVDVFALGTLIYEVYTGDIPYYGLDPLDIKDRILKDPSLPNKQSITKQVLETINKCRNTTPQQRPQVLTLLNSNIW